MMRSRFAMLAILTLAVCWLGPEAAFSQSCGCGPDFCQGDPRYAPRLAQAKAAMRNTGYPDELVALMDKDGACFARVDRAPTNFHIRDYASGTFQDVEWDEDNERISRAKLLNGTISVYYKYNTPRAFKCCGEKVYNERPDYDSTHDVNRSIVIECKKSGTTVTCQ
ncbi:putative translation elongation factor G [Bradyrhizobium oligotrophicum S58]|uniref:Putative translation elongation factor G n=2 Tax=Nitrobacteraceae TaxID=41294 RepID=M4Z7C3_9BRAD|nr:putative translation elongation factor G [Bradyrhizobium oligotrophicum S58]